MKFANQKIKVDLDMKEIAIIQAVLGFQIENYANVEDEFKDEKMDDGVLFMMRLRDNLTEQQEKQLSLIN